MKNKKKLKLSFNNFPVKIFGKGFNSSFSKPFYILFSKKVSLPGGHEKSPFFPIFLPLLEWRKFFVFLMTVFNFMKVHNE
jgi:hypothetical protein